MKVLGLNASARKEGNTSNLMTWVLDIVRSEKVDAELLHLADFQIRPCTSCEYEYLY